MNQPSRNFPNPWPRMALAAALTIWAGANMWSALLRMSQITDPDVHNRTVGVVLSIVFTLLPLVIAIYLFWTVVVGPEDPVATGKLRQKEREKRRRGDRQKGKKGNRRN
ncbi:MAG: hypothetical protein ACR2NP_17085 [Pirellulaceae bacterium]